MFVRLTRGESALVRQADLDTPDSGMAPAESPGKEPSRLPTAASGLVVGRVAAPIALTEPGELGPFPASGLPPGHPTRLHLQPSTLAGASMLSSTTARVVRDTHVLHPATPAPDRVALYGSASR